MKLSYGIDTRSFWGALPTMQLFCRNSFTTCDDFDGILTDVAGDCKGMWLKWRSEGRDQSYFCFDLLFLAVPPVL